MRLSHGPRAYRVRVPISDSGRSAFPRSAERVDLGDLLKLAEIVLLMGRQPTDHAIVRKEFGDVSTRDGQMQIVDAVGFLDRLDLRLERRQFPLHPGDLLTRASACRRPSPLVAASWFSDVAARNARANMTVKLTAAIIRSAASDLPHGRRHRRRMSNTFIEQGVSFSISAASGLIPSSSRETPQH